MRSTWKRSVVIGAYYENDLSDIPLPVPTNGSDGFLYIASLDVDGPPGGTPTPFAGRVPIVYNTRNNRLYVYNNGWKSVALAQNVGDHRGR